MAITPQKAEHPATMPFSSPAQPLHFPGMVLESALSLDVANLACDIEPSLAVMADLAIIPTPSKPCRISPTAKARAIKNAGIRRIF